MLTLLLVHLWAGEHLPFDLPKLSTETYPYYKSHITNIFDTFKDTNSQAQQECRKVVFKLLHDALNNADYVPQLMHFLTNMERIKMQMASHSLSRSQLPERTPRVSFVATNTVQMYALNAPLAEDKNPQLQPYSRWDYLKENYNFEGFTDVSSDPQSIEAFLEDCATKAASDQEKLKVYSCQYAFYQMCSKTKEQAVWKKIMALPFACIVLHKQRCSHFSFHSWLQPYKDKLEECIARNSEHTSFYKQLLTQAERAEHLVFDGHQGADYKVTCNYYLDTQRKTHKVQYAITPAQLETSSFQTIHGPMNIDQIEAITIFTPNPFVRR